MTDTANVIELTVDIISAHITKNSVQVDDLPDLITKVHDAMSQVAATGSTEPQELPKPAVSIRGSVRDDEIICLDCGKSFQFLKRHLTAVHGMSPQEYRTKWRLKPHYPMTAPNYSAARSKMAKASGLGRRK